VPGSGQQWKSLKSLPSSRAGGSLVYIKAQNALLYTGGAQRPGAYLDYNNSWLLPLNSNDGINSTWTAKPSLPFLANHMSYVSAKDDRGVERYFALGGQRGGDEANGNRDDLYEYNAMNETWIQRRKMPIARGHSGSATMAVSCGFIIAGGAVNSGSSSQKQTTDVSYYDIPSNTWSHVGNLTQGVRTICGIERVNNYLYCETGMISGKYSSRIRIQV
jgi:N-acetylneuraminic acid mutarotase